MTMTHKVPSKIKITQLFLHFYSHEMHLEKKIIYNSIIFFLMIMDIRDSKNLTLLKKQSKDLYYLKTSKK